MFHSFPDFKKKNKETKIFSKISLKEGSPDWHSQVTVGRDFVKKKQKQKLISVKSIINTVYFS